MAWNILPGTVTDLTVNEAIQELSIALKERSNSGVGIGSPTALNDIDAITAAYVLSLQTAIDGMLRLSFPNPNLGFINQTDNSGDWNGLSTPPPFWTEAAALTEIGAVSRIRLDINFAELWTVPVDWVNQSMELVNILQYVGSRSQPSSAAPLDFKTKRATAASPAAVIAAYAIAGELNDFNAVIGQGSTLKAGVYELESHVTRNLAYGTSSERAKLDSVDTYLFMQYPVFLVGVTNEIYDANGNAWSVENAYNIIRTDLSPITLPTVTFPFDDLTQPVLETTADTGRGWEVKQAGFNNFTGHIVGKYTFDKQV